MESSSCSFFTTANQQQGSVIERLGITPENLGTFLIKSIDKTDLVVANLNTSNFSPIKNLYNHKINENLKVNATYELKDAEAILCLSCRKFQKLTATYTFINIQNQMNFSVTNLQAHQLTHGNFESLEIDPLRLNRVLGVGYFNGEP